MEALTIDRDELKSAVTDGERLAVLRATDLLDSPPAPSLQNVVRLVQRLLGVRVAFIALIDEDRQYFANEVGLGEVLKDERQVPLSHSLCQYSVASREKLILEDTRRVPELAHAPAVTDLGVIGYAGVPLKTRGGHVLGSLCAVESTPRSWSERDVGLLEDLAAMARGEIEYRLKLHHLARAEAELARLAAPMASLADSVQTLTSLARGKDPRTARVASLVAERFSEAATVAGQLQHVTDVLAEPLHGRFTSLDVMEQVERAIDIAVEGKQSDAVSVTADHPPKTVVCDPYALERCLVHVLVSALHHVGDAGLVRVNVTDDGEMGLIDVSYTGSPMPAADVARALTLVHEAICRLPEPHDHGASTLRAVDGGLVTDHVALRARTLPGESRIVLRLPPAE